MQWLVSRLCCFLYVLMTLFSSCCIDDATSFAPTCTATHSINIRRQQQKEGKLHPMRALNTKAEDTVVMTGDAISLSLFCGIQSIVDPFEPSVAALLGGDAVANYRLDALANPFVAVAVIVPCWVGAGILFSDAYVVGSMLRTNEESLKNVLQTFLFYIPCVTIALAGICLMQNDGHYGLISAPDFTFCAGAISVVGSWRFTLASTIGK